MESTTYPLKQACCGGANAVDANQPRTIAPADVHPDTALVFDVRRESDYAASAEMIPGAMWKNPEKIDAWIGALPLTQDVVIYCVRGGGVSNSVVDRMHAAGIKARFIEGGIEAYKTAGGKVAAK